MIVVLGAVGGFVSLGRLGLCYLEGILGLGSTGAWGV